jgi:thiol:disulfide interchange protein DsbG
MAVVSSIDPRWAELGHSRWISDGRDDAPRKVYVFTDPNCPFCTKLWSDARPWVDSGRVQLRHVIVGVLTVTSEGKAAAMLGDKDPAGKLASYESSHAFSVASMLASGRPHPFEDASLVPLSSIPTGLQADLAGNLRLMTSLGIRATPGVAWLGADGKVQERQGLRPQDLADVFGPR